VAAGLDWGTNAKYWPVGLSGARGVRGGHPASARGARVWGAQPVKGEVERGARGGCAPLSPSEAGATRAGAGHG
jgi:hypothetical protein